MISAKCPLIEGDWKFIPPNNDEKYAKLVDIELGNDTVPQLYNLKADIGEKRNLAEAMPDKVREMQALLDGIKAERSN